MPHTWTHEDYAVSTEPGRLDLDVIHGFLTASYWAAGIPRDVVARAIAGSIPFGLYAGRDTGPQVGFARVVTDRATVGYLADVFVLEAHRGRGLGRFMMRCIDAHPGLQGFRRWFLVTRDAHALYRGCGYGPLAAPDRWMERRDPDVYRRAETSSREGRSGADGPGGKTP
jgi:GNAT superfamily N-acetyltransferase